MAPSPQAVDDATELTIEAWRVLENEQGALGLSDLRIQPAGDFIASAERNPTTPAERTAILDQAALLFTHLYPHLPFKAEIYNMQNPVEWMEQNLRPHVATLSERDFHSSMIDMFTLVCDPHTLYGLPSPYRGAVAFLPFQMRSYTDESGTHYVVTKVMKTRPDGSFGHPWFGTGAEIVVMADQPVDTFMQWEAARLFGGNESARLMRATIHTTVRPLTFCQPPFDDQLPVEELQYRPLGSSEVRILRIPWAVATGLGQAGGIPSKAFSISSATAAMIAHTRQLHPDGDLPVMPDAAQVSQIPEVFQFRAPIDLPNPGDPEGRYGYLRIRSFTDGSSAPGLTDRLVEEFRRILTMIDQSAPEGVVLDIRGNPGGDVQAAERMLQMLTPRRIEPARFHLANTPAVLDILRRVKTALADRDHLTPEEDSKLTDAHVELGPWFADSDNQPLPEGERLTSGQTLTDPESANEIGQVYQGRLALLVDGLTYSAADIFAGGFQDHGIGLVVGPCGTTGGGGANVWSHEDLLTKLGPSPGLPLARLPRDATMSIAIRRSSRVGPFAGRPVEDVGVHTDAQYVSCSLDDLIAGQPGIVSRACQLLAELPLRRVDVSGIEIAPDGSVHGELRTINIAAVKFYLDGTLSGEMAIEADGVHDCRMSPASQDAPSELRIEGYFMAPRIGPLLAAVRTVVLRAPEPPSDEPDTVTQSITGTDTP
jgi:hypothetical protein